MQASKMLKGIKYKNKIFISSALGCNNFILQYVMEKEKKML
jgi:hypothetical protein